MTIYGDYAESRTRNMAIATDYMQAEPPLSLDNAITVYLIRAKNIGISATGGEKH